MRKKLLGRKHTITAEAWDAATDIIETSVTEDDLENLIDQTTDDILRTIRGKRVGYGWSGGKDAIALRWVLEAAGLQLPSFISLAPELEWPKFLQWVDVNGPDGLEKFDCGVDYQFLRDHPEWVFPNTYALTEYWADAVQRAGWKDFHHRHQTDLIAVGKRRNDGNFCGTKATNSTRTKDGTVTWSPLADWKHEHIVALLKYKHLTLPDAVYRDQPDGFAVSTGPWPKRYTPEDDRPRMWDEVYRADPTVVHRAAGENIPGAALYLKENE